MLRKRSSILTIKSLSNVSSCPLLSPLIHHRRRIFTTAAIRADIMSDPNGSNPQDPFGSDREIPTNSLLNQTRVFEKGQNPKVRQLNSNGFSAESGDFYKRSNLGEVQQFNSNGVFRENPNGYKESNFGQFSQSDSNGIYGNNSSSHQRGNFKEVQQSNSHGFCAGNSDGYQRSNFGEVSQLNSDGFYGENSRLHHRGDFGECRPWNPNYLNGKTSDGYQRSNFGEVSQLNSNGIHRDNSSSHQRGNLGEYSQSNSNGFFGQNVDGYKKSSLGEVRQLKSSGFYVETPNTHHRNNVGEVQQPYSYGFYGQNPDGYQRSNFGEVQQSNSNGFYRDYTSQMREDGFQKGSSRIGEMEANGHYKDSNGVYKENHRDTGNFYQNSGFGYNTVSAEEPYQNPSEFSRENPNQKSAEVAQRPSSHGFSMETLTNPAGFYQNPRGHCGENSVETFQQIPNGLSNNIIGGNGEPGEFQKNPNGYYEVSSGEVYQNFYGYNRENTLPEGQQNFSKFPLTSVTKVNGDSPGDKSPETGESSSYKGTLDELDKFCEEGKLEEAVEVLALLGKNGVFVDLPRYLKLLHACGEAKSLEEARIVHDHLFQAMGEVGVVVHNKILDMYAKCSSMSDAYQLFEKLPQRNLTSWDTMITGLANNNLGEEAIDIFTQFKDTGLRPDGGLFIAVFNACGVLGAVDEGMLHFESMEVDFDIAPTMEHYVSIIHMLGRSGYLDEALEFIEKMPIEPSIDVWETLMTLCRLNGYEELGDRCAEIVEHLDSSRLTEQSKMGLLPVKTFDKKKERNNNSDLLDVKHRRYELRAGDRSHPESDRIYEQIRVLVPNMKEAGYVPNTRWVLHDVDQETKEEALLSHSERLVAAYSLLITPARAPIRIMKNLRFCADCHEAMKIISKLTGRLIISRDAKRFHHFENGVCSCKDYY